MGNVKNKDCESCASRDKGVFCSLEMMELQEITRNKTTNNYKKGSVIFHQGNPSFGLYCVNSGRVKLTQIGNDGKESIVRIAGPGDVLGHRSLFSQQAYHATATAMEESVICFMSKDHVYKVIKNFPSVALNIIVRLSKEMGQAERRSSSMFQKSVRERLAELFVTLSSTYGIRENDGRMKLNIRLTREEMASMSGTASETVIRFISEFKEEGLIAQEGKTIFILDQERLLDLANLSF